MNYRIYPVRRIGFYLMGKSIVLLESLSGKNSDLLQIPNGLFLKGVDAVKDEYMEAQQKQEKSYVPPERNALNQKIIDLQRLKIMRHLLENYANGDERALEMKHLWYERNDDRIYGMRPGPAPMPGKREPHLRGFDLNLDFNKLPELLKKAESYAREDKPAAGNDDDWGD